MATVQVHTSKDAEISNHSITSWYIFQSGKATSMHMGCSDWTTVPTRGWYGYQERMLMKFDLPVLPTSSIVSSAILNVYLGPNNAMHSWNDGLYTYNQNPTIDIHQMLQDWDEGSGDGQTNGYQYSGATWTNRTANGFVWNQYGGYYSTTPAVSQIVPYQYGWVQFDISALVNTWYSTNNYGMIMKYHNDTTLQGQFYTFTREAGNGLSPYVQITYSAPPEKSRGLYPNFNSTVSPQIPSSTLLNWTFVSKDTNDTLLKSMVTISKINGDSSRTLITTATVTGGITHYDVSGLGLTDGSVYEWSVVAYNAANIAGPASDKAVFKYRTLSVYTPVAAWSTLPSTGQTIKTNFLSEIRTHLHNEILKYTAIDASQTDALFLSVIPSKGDYNKFAKLMTSLYASHGKVYPNKDLVGMSFGVSSILNTRKVIDDLIAIPPIAPIRGSMSITSGQLNAPASITPAHASTTDLNIIISWNASAFTASTMNLTLSSSTDGDIYYYKATYTQVYGAVSYVFTLYFTPDQILSNILIPMNDATTTHTVSYKAVDKNNIASAAATITVTGLTAVANASPVAIDRYVVEYQVKYYTATEPDLNSPWIKIYEGSALTFTHHVTGQATYWYRVKAYDRNGNQTGYTYSTNQIIIMS